MTLNRIAAVLLAVLVGSSHVATAQYKPGSAEDFAALVPYASLAYAPAFYDADLNLPPDTAAAVGRLRIDAREDTASVEAEALRRFVFRPVYRRHAVMAFAEAPSDTAVGAVVPPATSSVQPGGDFLGNPRLKRSGSISRGMTAGNRRDVSVESGLRMELSGEIAEGVSVQAVMTDENTPIQPEGTTQRLSEFDKVAIGIQSKYGSADLGDFDLAFRASHYAEFNRKLQGATFRLAAPASDGGVFGGGQVRVAAAVARGQYRQEELRPIDGVQGPYRLTGSAGESFIIVIAGSEVVYMDGVRLERGETNDYVIDYQTGEITFTAARLVTDHRRIVVEFQYTSHEYTRAFTGMEMETRWGLRDDGSARATLGMTFLREADSRRMGSELGFSHLDSLLIASSGDAPAFRSGAEPVVGRFDPEAPFAQYLRRIVPTEAGADTIFVPVRSLPADTVRVYRVRFTFAGEGKGSYRRSTASANGVEYEYEGRGLGGYLPVRQLPKPSQQHVLDLNGSIEPLPGVRLHGEWARSLLDENRLSNLDEADNVGHAHLAGVEIAPLGVGPLGKLSARYEWRKTAAHFPPFNRVRPVEFARRWNIGADATTLGMQEDPGGREETHEAGATVAFSERSRWSGEWGSIRLGEAFAGTRWETGGALAEAHGPQLEGRIEYIESRDSLRAETGSWLRQSGAVSQPLLAGRFLPRFEVEFESRRQSPLGSDSLTFGSLGFAAYRPALHWTQDHFEAGTSLEYRREKDPNRGALQHSADSWTLQSQVKVRGQGSFFADATAGYRVREIDPTFAAVRGSEATESVILKGNASWAPLRRAVDASAFYEGLTERTPQMQEVFIRTDAEYGQFSWEDLNGDGLPQTDEFLPERTPNEGLYVAAFLPSDTLVGVVGVQARFRLQLDPSRKWRGRSGLPGILSNVSTRSTFEVQEKSRDADLAAIYALNLSHFLNPATTMNGRIRVAQDVYLFKGKPAFGLDLGFNQVRSLSQLSGGLERRSLQSWRAEARVRPSEFWSGRLLAERERNRVESRRYASRTFDIDALRLHPEMSFNPSRGVQVLAGLAGAWKEDLAASRSARVLRLPLETRLSVPGRMQVTARLEAADVRLSGGAVGLAEYELTDGRGPGRSFLWSAGADYTLNSYIRATLAYDGRAPSGAPVVHTMRLQMTALF